MKIWRFRYTPLLGLPFHRTKAAGIPITRILQFHLSSAILPTSSPNLSRKEKKMYKKRFGFLICAFLFLPLIGCPMYTAVGFKYAEASDGGDGDGQTTGTDPDEIEVTEESVTLAWDSPSPDIDFYKLLFRIHGANPPESWLVLEENLSANPTPEYTVNNADIGNGVFDFGVVAKDLDADTEESSLHSSLDTTAQPDTGWYLIWMH
jgi:hypothetical protein